MSQQQNNNEKKTTEKCQCTKKVMALDKAFKELKAEVEQNRKILEIIKKSLKR